MKLKRGIIIILATVLVITFFPLASRASIQDSNQLLAPDAMQEDLYYLEEAINEIHPNPYHAVSKEEWERQWAELYQQVKEPMTLGDFYFTLLQGMYLVHDAHTSVFLNSESFTLPVEFRWLEDGLMIANHYQGVERGDQVLEIGGQSVDKIFTRLTEMVPAENQYWVKYVGEKSLNTRLWLKHLGLVDPDRQVQLKIQNAAGEVRTVTYGFQRKESTSINQYEYHLYPEQNLAVLTLNVCTNDQRYQQMLAKFFALVREKGITRIAIDVRKNTGGNSAVINEFLTYINVEKYQGFDSNIHYSKWAVKVDGWWNVVLSNLFHNPAQRIKHKDVELFDGQLYVLTSKTTFSSANWFGVILQDNQLGTVVGEPTGNAPTSYGYPLAGSLPNTGLRFNISHVSWIRPDREQNDARTLVPDIYIPLTQQDLRLNRDPLVEWLLKNR